jgi:hypothetical protein
MFPLSFCRAVVPNPVGGSSESVEVRAALDADVKRDGQGHFLYCARASTGTALLRSRPAFVM